MTIINHRFLLLGLAVTALLVALIVATGPPAGATTRAGLPPGCGAPTMFGLHGMGEGPNTPGEETYPLSPEISGFDDAQNILSGAVLMQFVPYMTVQPDAWEALQAVWGQGQLWASVEQGEENLQAAVVDAANANAANGPCPPSDDKFYLVGYSEGGWVINEWLRDHQDEWSSIKGVVLFGDACWTGYGAQGLARIFTPTCGYSGAPFWTWTDCRSGDPVCGVDWADSSWTDHLKQLYWASNCLPTKWAACPHLHYTDGAPSSGDLMDGARYLVQHLD